MPPQRKRTRRRSAPSDPNQRAAQLLEQGKLLDALTLLDDTICAGRATLETWSLTGQGLIKANEHAQAIDALQRAVELAPSDTTARFNLAGSLYQMGDVSAATRLFEELARGEGNFNAWCNLATIVPGDPHSDNARVLEIRRQFAEQLATQVHGGVPAEHTPDEPRQETQNGTLRIGYVSAFFASENYMKPVWELLRRHDRSKFEIVLFADDVTRSQLQWFQPAAGDEIFITTSLDNEQLVKLIRRQALDVLVDLNAYSVPQRLPIYVSRLAPAVAAWFNMYATSGLPGIDWLIGDDYVVNESEERYFSERIVRLPQSYLSFDVVYKAPDVVDPPLGRTGRCTFGSLVSQYKITEQVHAAWAQILQQAPIARLFLANRCFASESNRDYVLQKLQRLGVDRDRIELSGPAEHFDFLKYYDQIDIALDAFPYNGGTTTTEAIWQGVPVLAVNGDRWAARTSRTLLMNGHLHEFVAESVEDYVQRAVAWANDPQAYDKLRQLRHSMRDELRQQPVCNVDSMVEAMENALLHIAR